MPQELRVIDTILPQQMLVVGRAADALTGRPPTAPLQVELLYQTAPDEPERPYPLTARLKPGALFVFSGDPGRAFPIPPPPDSLDLRLRIRAEGYQEAVADFSLNAAARTPTGQTLEVDERTVTVPVLASPLHVTVFTLQPLPVQLAGRVVRADTPSQAVAGATLQVTAPAPGPGDPPHPQVASSNRGYFTMPPLPVASEVTVRVERAGFTILNETIRPDYSQPVNRHTFFLETS